MSIGRMGERFSEDRRERKLPALLHADDLVLYDELEEEELRVVKILSMNYAKEWV